MEPGDLQSQETPQRAANQRDAQIVHLLARLRSLRDALRAARQGDFSVRLPTNGRDEGVVSEVAQAFNALVEQNEALSLELERVARSVGAEGDIAGRSSLAGAGGAWASMLDSVNRLIASMAFPTLEATRILDRAAAGDFSRDMPVHMDGQPLQGEFLRLGESVNHLVDRLRFVSHGVSRVLQQVGSEGKLGARASTNALTGTWMELVELVNRLSDNLTGQVRNITSVSRAIADGDLSQKVTVESQGEILELKSTINTTVDQLRAFAAEVIRVGREVGTEGKLGGRADVRNVSGIWQELTDNVNMMARNLTAQVRGIAQVVTAVAQGDLTQKLVVEAKGEMAELADTINDMTDTLRTFAEQVSTVASEVGFEGKLGGQARVPGVAGTWRDLTDNVNMLAGNLTNQVRNIALVTTAVANGDLSQKITVDAKGEILELKNTLNAMVDQLRTFAKEVTRVAREVGTDGKLGGQADVPGVGGTWQELTESVNVMASNLTSQVRGIAKVVTAVASGNLTQKLVLEARGEIAALADTINDMTETLRTFADQVTTVAREVGLEGQLGGQAKVPGAAGTWRDLVDNVNQLAGNLTTQVRAIADVASAVTEGDLTRTIDVEALGEVLALKDTINQMIANLRDTTRTNQEQDWLKTNLARFSGMMQGQRNIESLARLIMSELTPLVSAQLGTFFVMNAEQGQPVLKLVSTYGYTHRKSLANRFRLGEGVVGQVALERKPILISHVPADYVAISSSLGAAAPTNLIVLPILYEGAVKGVIELGSFEPFSSIHITFLEQLTLSMGVVLNMISASRRTEELLEELKSSNVELGQRSTELEEKAHLLEVRNREIAEASASLEEKANQLALVSKYKSEFLANMSHELRTPLNSIIILSNLLVENTEHNLSDEQIEYASTVLSSGRDLLALIDQILDLSKIEAGRMEVERRPVPIGEIVTYAEHHFGPVARQKGLNFITSIAPEVPPTITTDGHRVQQILKNLLSNAFKFTDEGSVELRVELESNTDRFRNQTLRRASTAMGFVVTDTGIGIPAAKQQLIFEAFQQVDPSTSRIYGGTGLGLTISRELARILGGEIYLHSTPGVGSTFALYLPLAPDAQRHVPVKATVEPSQGGFEITHTAEPSESTPALAKEATGVPKNRVSELSDNTVLVVDDDVRNLFAVTALLERRGVTVLPASSAQEAFEQLQSHPEVGLVMMDVMMPEMDGLEATRQLRGNPRYATLPIIALTAKAMQEDKERALVAGCNDYVAKPVEQDRLMEVVTRWLGWAQKTQQTS